VASWEEEGTSEVGMPSRRVSSRRADRRSRGGIGAALARPAVGVRAAPRHSRGPYAGVSNSRSLRSVSGTRAGPAPRLEWPPRDRTRAQVRSAVSKEISGRPAGAHFPAPAPPRPLAARGAASRPPRAKCAPSPPEASPTSAAPEPASPRTRPPTSVDRDPARRGRASASSAARRPTHA
jgi:hypothetical protein